MCLCVCLCKRERERERDALTQCFFTMDTGYNFLWFAGELCPRLPCNISNLPLMSTWLYIDTFLGMMKA